MGQYYQPILGDKFGCHCVVFDRSINGTYTPAKLMEHSWWDNDFVNSFSARLYKHKRRVIWCGDYAEPDDFNFQFDSPIYVPNYYEIWGETTRPRGSKSSAFTLDDKFLINHDTRQFVDLNEYKAISTHDNWIVHPLPLLTAVGNGRGFGDFHEGNIGYEHVGIWAWNLLSIVDSIPHSFSKFNLVFKEIRR